MKRPDFMALALKEAEAAALRGEVPVGAVIATGSTVVASAGNRTRELADPTAHAEMLVIRQACGKISSERLTGHDLYVTLEPCAMCAGAIYWVGIGRLVFGLGEKRLKAITGAHPENPTLDMPCRDVFAAGQKTVEVIGPMLEDEAAAQHENFWAHKP